MKLTIALAALACASCGGTTQREPTAAEHARVLSYEDELTAAEAACVHASPTLEESHACRAREKARINAKYGRTP